METTKNIFADLTNEELQNKTAYATIDEMTDLCFELSKRLSALEEKHKDQAIKVTRLSSFPPNCNPFHYDLGNMGTPIVGGWMAMHSGFYGEDRDGKPHRDPDNIILVNSRTGRRFKIDLREYDYSEYDPTPWKVQYNYLNYMGEAEIPNITSHATKEAAEEFIGELTKNPSDVEAKLIEPVFGLDQCNYCKGHFIKACLGKTQTGNIEETICAICAEKYLD